MTPWMVCFAGLPGVGKSTVARGLAERTGALWLRIDSIERAMRKSHMVYSDLADGGYAAAQAVAGAALVQGFDVVADCVNPLPITRGPWQAVSKSVGAAHLDVELVCTDTAEHRRRVEARRAAPEGVELPDWQAVSDREYVPFPGALRLDTARLTALESVETLCREMEARGWI